jgi:hypothetical protein
VSKIALGNIVCSSFRWLLVLCSAWMWNLSSVFRCAPFLWNSSICMVFCMVPNGCACSSKCLAKLDV